MGTMLVGAMLVNSCTEVDATVGAGEAGGVETTEVSGGDEASVLVAKPKGTVVSSVELALVKLAEALLSAVADTAVASEVMLVVEAPLETAEDAESVAEAETVPDETSRVVALDKGIEVDTPITPVVIVPLLGANEATEDA